jgi:hypothetical protein
MRTRVVRVVAAPLRCAGLQFRRVRAVAVPPRCLSRLGVCGEDADLRQALTGLIAELGVPQDLPPSLDAA